MKICFSDVLFCIKDDSLSVAVRQNFLDYLLSTYRTLERSFMRNLYELHKAFEFRTLWVGNNPLASFQRVASESALGTGRLNGAVQLTDVLTNMKRLQDKAVKCFTNNIYATGIKRWHFNIGRDRKVSHCNVHLVLMLKIYSERGLGGGRTCVYDPE